MLTGNSPVIPAADERTGKTDILFQRFSPLKARAPDVIWALNTLPHFFATLLTIKHSLSHRVK
jgi:hypothetical protein